MSINNPSAGKARPGTTLTVWTPEDKAFWAAEGQAIAKLNLWISVPALFLAFAIWQMWSVVAVNLPMMGFNYTTNQLFWLASAPALSGATLRIFYSFMVPLVGGRRWTAISTASLLVPAIGIGFAVQDPTTPYPTMLILALLCGFGGGNFSSSMSNISFFFPKERKGSALGVNAGLGNLGVSVVQFLSPIIISLAAWFFMNDIADAKASFATQAAIFRSKHNWLMCVLYLGTFGSFIGYAAGFPLLIKSQFTDVNPLAYAWIGPLVGALIRPVGGWLSDKLGGARVTFWNFIVMALAVVGVLFFLPKGTGSAYALSIGPLEGNFTGFFLMFLVLFLTTGIGNGSTFRMIPVIFLNLKTSQVKRNDEVRMAAAVKEANTEAAAVLGFTAAVAAYGGFFIPKSYGTSIGATGGPELALMAFIAFYLLCIVTTWWYYARKGAEQPC